MTLVGPLILTYKLSAGSSPISRQSSLHILLSHRKGLLTFLAILPCASMDCSIPVIWTIPPPLCNHDDTIALQLHNKPPIPLACLPCFRAQAIQRATRLCPFPRKGLRAFPKCSSLNHILTHVHKLWVAPPCPAVYEVLAVSISLHPLPINPSTTSSLDPKSPFLYSFIPVLKLRCTGVKLQCTERTTAAQNLYILFCKSGKKRFVR